MYKIYMSSLLITGQRQEREINMRLSEILCAERGWTVVSERTRTVYKHPGKQPDIIVDIGGGGGGNAVIIETEISPASTLEKDVASRFGKSLAKLGKPAATIGIILPKNLVKKDRLTDDDLRRARMEYFVSHSDGTRFPPKEKSYLRGTLTDIRTAVQLCSVPYERVRLCVDMMQEGIDKISHVIDESNDSVKDSICKHVKLFPGSETWDMASLILLNAGIFYEELSKHRNDVTPTQQLTVVDIPDQKRVIGAWEDVLKIDYAPIFQDAVKILASFPSETAVRVLDVISGAVSSITALRVSKSGDVYGALCQGMLGESSDKESTRKKIAAFYTKPTAAALLAGLVMPPPDDGMWDDRELTGSLRIADFACGTGMLLTAAYNHMIFSSNFDMSEHHAHIMENCLYGYDILPTATHLAVSNMAGLFPDVKFDMVNVYTVDIGPSKKGGGYNLGSLEAIGQDSKLVPTSEQHGGLKSKRTAEATIRHGTCDCILMNPPFVRPTNHANRTAPVPPFALFGIAPEHQIAMADKTKRDFAGTCATGNAGLGSHFMAICDKKLKKGGMLGLILPETVSSGASWSDVRELLGKKYADIMLVSVGAGTTYSSDTGMNEVMLVARKLDTERRAGEEVQARLVVLNGLPESRLAAVEAAKAIRNTPPVRLENCMGSTSIMTGGDVIGQALDCPVVGGVWWARRTSNLELLQFAYSLAYNIMDVPMANLADLASIGFGARDIIEYRFSKESAKPRAPFYKRPPSGQKYAALWSNNAEEQRSMLVNPDCGLEKNPRAAVEHVKRVWGTASRTHLNLRARYASQRLTAAYTAKKTLGGSGWPNVSLNEEKYEKAFMVWCNSAFGIVTYWAFAGSQQHGRGIMSPTTFREAFRVLDFSKLTGGQIGRFDRLFHETRDLEMKPINRLDKDGARHKLDRGVLDILGADIGISLDTLYDMIMHERQFDRRDLGA